MAIQERRAWTWSWISSSTFNEPLLRSNCQGLCFLRMMLLEFWRSLQWSRSQQKQYNQHQYSATVSIKPLGEPKSGYLCAANTGQCPKMSKTFGEIMYRFIWGIKEMCLLSDHRGNLDAITCAKKLNKLLQDCRVSINMVCIVLGTCGYTIKNGKFYIIESLKSKFWLVVICRFSLHPNETIHNLGTTEY